VAAKAAEAAAVVAAAVAEAVVVVAAAVQAAATVVQAAAVAVVAVKFITALTLGRCSALRIHNGTLPVLTASWQSGHSGHRYYCVR
jgi:hypothetical protein